MIVIKFGKWKSYGARIFHYERIYYKGKKTPFCKMRLRRYCGYKYYGEANGDETPRVEIEVTE